MGWRCELNYSLKLYGLSHYKFKLMKQHMNPNQLLLEYPDRENKLLNSRGGVRSVQKVQKQASVERAMPKPQKKVAYVSVENVRPQETIVKPKKKKTKKKRQVINFQDEEEAQRLEEEKRRREELERYRREQYEKMSREERQRLGDERDESLARINHYYQELSRLQDHQRVQEEWEQYIQCSAKHNPKAEKDLSVLLFQLGETAVELDCKALTQKFQTAVDVLDAIEAVQLTHSVKQSVSEVAFSRVYAERIKELILRKIDEVGQRYVTQYDEFLHEHNKALVEKFLSKPLIQQHMKAILTNIASKPEERLKYEILRTWTDSPLFKFGIWYNPINKAGYRMKPIEYPSLNKLSIELPRLYMAQSLIYKMWWFDRNLYEAEYDQYKCLGGIYVPECLDMITTAKRSSRWIMKPAFDNPEQFIKKLKYPPKFSMASQGQYNYPPLKVSFDVPDTFFAQDGEQLFVVCYRHEWTQEGIEELKVDLVKRQVQFTMGGLYPFMLAQLRSVDFPYRNWKLCQTNEKQVQLILITQRELKLEFQVNNSTVELKQPTQLIKQFPQLQGTCGFAELLLKIQSIGINLLPTEEDAVLCQSVFKLTELEDQVLMNIVQALSVLSFKSNRFSRITPAQSMVLSMIENSNQKPDIDEDLDVKWKCVGFEFEKCAFINLKESDTQFQNDWLPGTLSHINLFLLLRNHHIVAQELVDRIESIENVEFKENVRTFLKMIKILCMG